MTRTGIDTSTRKTVLKVKLSPFQRACRLPFGQCVSSRTGGVSGLAAPPLQGMGTPTNVIGSSIKKKRNTAIVCFLYR